MNVPQANDPVIVVTLASGQAHRTTRAHAVKTLRSLHEFYSGQEKDWWEKTYQPKEPSGAFNDGYEREWIRYREEAAALQVAIDALTALDGVAK